MLSLVFVFTLTAFRVMQVAGKLGVLLENLEPGAVFVMIVRAATDVELTLFIVSSHAQFGTVK